MSVARGTRSVAARNSDAARKCSASTASDRSSTRSRALACGSLGSASRRSAKSHALVRKRLPALLSFSQALRASRNVCCTAGTGSACAAASSCWSSGVGAYSASMAVASSFAAFASAGSLARAAYSRTAVASLAAGLPWIFTRNGAKLASRSASAAACCRTFCAEALSAPCGSSRTPVRKARKRRPIHSSRAAIATSSARANSRSSSSWIAPR
jgi:hypothetical protein